MNKIYSLVKYILGWPLSIIAIFFILKLIYSKSNSLLPNIKQINISLLLLGIVCFVFYYFFRAFLWQIIIKEKGVKLPLKELAFVYSSAQLKRFVPGNIWSFLGMTVAFSERGVPKKVIMSSFLIEIEFLLIAGVILSLFCLRFILSFFNLNYFSVLIIIIAAIITILILLIIIFKKKVINLIKKLIPDFSLKKYFVFISISIICLIFFGLGTYFSISSISFLSPHYLLTFVSFFVLSLLIGYLSVITPMGLGVREGVITLGLSKFIAFDMAALGSIFARIFLIISEMIFLFLSYIWNRTKNKFVVEAGDFIDNHKHEAILVLLIIVYVSYFTVASVLRYQNFYTGRFDLGNMDQTVWNSAHGRLFQLTDPNGTNIISRLSFHADFILVLFAPFYLIWNDPRTLLIIQTLILGSGAIFIYLLGLHILKNKNLAITFSVAYLLNPAIQYTNLYDFHAVALATTFLLATFYFLVRKNYFLFILFAILSGLTKEEIWIITGLFGAYIVILSFLKKEILPRIIGFSIFALSFSVFYYLIWIAIPQVRGGGHFALSYYSDFGTGPSEIIKNIIFNPQKTLMLVFGSQKIEYLKQIFLPLGYLSLLSPFSLIFALPELLINLLSNNVQLSQIYYQYTSAITPFIFISSIFGVKTIKRITIKIPNYVIIFYITIVIVYSAYSFGPLPGAKNPNLTMFTKPQEYKEIIDDFLMKIPRKYSIAATNNIGSHLSHRQKIFTVPIGFDKADIVAFLLNDPFAQPSLAAQKEFVKKMKEDKNYIQVFQKGDFIVFEKRNLYIKSPPKSNQDKLFPLSITALQNRDYVGGEITTEEIVAKKSEFNSYIIYYPSDGLKLRALMNIPKDKTPDGGFPVIIINHGYINPKTYSTKDSYKQITDFFSSRGFVVLKPDYRGNGESEPDNNFPRFAYPVDVLNLIASVKNIKEANPNKIYLWGHSMGGEVTLKVLEIISHDPHLKSRIKAAVLWAPVTDTAKWFELSHVRTLPEASLTPFPYSKTYEVLGTPEENPKLWQSLSPLNFLKDITIPIQLNHATTDETVPYEWSEELNNDLLQINKNVEFISYPNDNHNISNNWSKAANNSLNFINKYQ